MTNLPTLEAARALEPSLSFEIEPGMIDINGHMNFINYFRMGMEALRELIADRLGLSEGYVSTRGLGAFVAEQYVRYLCESRLGDRMVGCARVLTAAPKSFVVEAILVNMTASAVVCVVRTRYVHVDLGSRRPTPFPDDVGRQLLALAAETELSM
jgi:acyl-CoA thioesterase FadM